MSRWFETTAAIKAIEDADERLCAMQEEREDERKRRLKAEARVAELEAQKSEAAVVLMAGDGTEETRLAALKILDQP